MTIRQGTGHVVPVPLPVPGLELEHVQELHRGAAAADIEAGAGAGADAHGDTGVADGAAAAAEHSSHREVVVAAVDVDPAGADRAAVAVVDAVPEDHPEEGRPTLAGAPAVVRMPHTEVFLVGRRRELQRRE